MPECERVRWREYVKVVKGMCKVSEAKLLSTLYSRNWKKFRIVAGESQKETVVSDEEKEEKWGLATHEKMRRSLGSISNVSVEDSEGIG